MDFYFPDKGKASRFISFLENSVPTKVSEENDFLETTIINSITSQIFPNKFSYIR